ncbi:hypothetical protein HDV57DRAFT_383711 [Trichoderma longibrachiatum]
MAPRLRAKPATHARMQRTATQFSELEVTPSRHEDIAKVVETTIEINHTETLEAPGPGVRSSNPFSWSDAGSTSNTRRSSPTNIGEIPADDIWQFDDLESLDPFSSPGLADSCLPDTIPILEKSAICENEAKVSNTPRRHIDFSETASTARRSSPFVTSDARPDVWDFEDSPNAAGSSPNTTNGILESLYAPADDLYEATPKKPGPPAPAVVDQSVHASKASSQPGQKAKRRQRAKEPIRFDSRTQEIVEVPAAKKKSTASRLPIVRALQEAAAASSSPLDEGKKKKTRKAAKGQPIKKRKPESPSVRINPPPPRDAQPALPDNSPAVVLIRGSSVSIGVPCPELHGAANTNLPVSTVVPANANSPANPSLPAHASLPATTNLPANTNLHANTNLSASTNLPARTIGVSTSLPEPKRCRPPSPAAINERDNEQEPDPCGQHKPKRRRFSRQFSVFERGSPVVVKDTAPSRRVEPVPPQADPVVTSIPGQHPATQHPSFLRSKSTDKQIEQNHDSAFGDIQGKSSSQWLRRLSHKEPLPKRRPSLGKKLHEEIMKSFLQHTEVEHEVPKTTLAPAVRGVDAAGGVDITHVNKQIRLTIEQLIARLDGKKAAAYNVANVYRSGGKESLSAVRQRLAKDQDSLAATWSGRGDVFHRNVMGVKETVSKKSISHAEMALGLNEILAARRQARGRVRQGLRALRDECLRDNKAVAGQP